MLVNDPELGALLSLRQIPGIGDVLMRNLISYCGGAAEVFKTKRPRLLQVPGIGEVLADNIIAFRNFERAEQELAFIDKHHIQVHYFLDESYPYRLRDLPDAPVMLFGLGQMNLNAGRMVGIVGTRRASEYGKQMTQQLVKDLQEHGVQVVSGLALGIDGIAHRACLDEGVPTIGVLAHGLDRIYPPQHQTLAKKMLANGGLLTDFLAGTNPDRENFPKRNRIVAGLSDVLVVVESGYKGGARITAEIAFSYNKDVMAVPGRTNDYYSQGCNQLIKENKAAMLTSIDDLLELMGWEKTGTGKSKEKEKQKEKQQQLILDLGSEAALIVELLRSRQRMELDLLAFELGMDPGTISLKLLEMEFSGLVRSLPGKVFELV